MRHPNDGTLRRLLDEPAGVAVTDREHIAGCPACLSALTTMKEDAMAVHDTLNLDTDPDLDTAWQRLSRAVEREPQAGAAKVPARRRLKALLRSPLVAVVGVVVVLGAAGTAAATDWLPIFQPERVQPVTAPRADLIQLPELDEFGDLQVTSRVDVRPVADAAAAEKLTGLAVPRVGALPRGVTGEPSYFAGPQASAVFTFRVEKAAKTVAARGGTLPPPPPGLDGAQFRFVAGPGVVTTWLRGRGVPALVVARATAPVVYSSSVSFDTARNYVLSLPNVPESVRSQLRGFSGDGSTMPLFVQEEKLATGTADVGGAPATVLASRDGALAAVVWVDHGLVTAVAGPLSTDEVLSVARGLKVGR